MHRLIIVSFIAVLAAGCGGGGKNNCTNCGPKSANLQGSVTGLLGYRLALQNGSTPLTVSLNGATGNGTGVLFGTAPFNSNYSITVATQPTTPSQTCVTLLISPPIWSVLNFSESV